MFEQQYDVVVAGAGVAGCAAALAVQAGVTPDLLPVDAKQAALRARGFVLHVDELPPSPARS